MAFIVLMLIGIWVLMCYIAYRVEDILYELRNGRWARAQHELRDLLSGWTLDLADDARAMQSDADASLPMDGDEWAVWLERKAEEVKNGK